MKYRKKPVFIDAYQWFPRKVTDKNHREGVGMLYKDVYMESSTEEGRPIFVIDTPEGKYIVSAGDWIITSVKGEKYPCKPDIFELTYEKVK